MHQASDMPMPIHRLRSARWHGNEQIDGDRAHIRPSASLLVRRLSAFGNFPRHRCGLRGNASSDSSSRSTVDQRLAGVSSGRRNRGHDRSFNLWPDALARLPR